MTTEINKQTVDLSVPVHPWTDSPAEQKWDNGNRGMYSVSRLIALSEQKGLVPFLIPMKGLNIYNLYPEITSMLSFVEHIKNVLNADLNTPILLDYEGFVMDGRHRIAKALLQGEQYILAVRFDEYISPDYIRMEDDKK